MSDLTFSIIEAIQDKKGRRINVIDLSGNESAPSPCLVICHGNTPTQVSAIADSVRDAVAGKLAVRPIHYEGYRNAQWIIIDYGNVAVHIFTPQTREFYSLESLWNDFPIRSIPDVD